MNSIIKKNVEVLSLLVATSIENENSKPVKNQQKKLKNNFRAQKCLESSGLWQIINQLEQKKKIIDNLSINAKTINLADPPILNQVKSKSIYFTSHFKQKLKLDENNTFVISAHTKNVKKREENTGKFIFPDSPKNSSLSYYRKLPLFESLNTHSKTIAPISEQAAICIFGGTQYPKIVISGGLGNGVNKGLFIYDLDSTVFNVVHPESDIETARFGHTICGFEQSQILFFGGDFAFRVSMNSSEGLSPATEIPPFLIYCNINNSLREVIPFGLRKPKHRKYHASFMFEEKYMFIFGGVKMNFKFLNDLWIFDTEENTWHEFRVENEEMLFLQEGIAHHKMTLLSSNIFKLSEIEFQKNEKEEIKDEKLNKTIYILKSHKKNILFDVYLFGGINEVNELLDNKLYQLGMKNQIFYLKEVEITGSYKPLKRFSHSLNSSKTQRQLIMIGGKSETGQILGDINIFDFGKKTWTLQQLKENNFSNGITDQCCEVYDNCVFVFGGIDRNGFRTSKLSFFTFCS